MFNLHSIFAIDKPTVKVHDFPTWIAGPGSLNLNFSVDSYPASNVTVFHNGEKLRFFSNFIGDKQFEIEISSCLNEGEYRVVAENIMGSISVSKNLNVECKYR
jgi:hypothetical protein